MIKFIHAYVLRIIRPLMLKMALEGHLRIWPLCLQPLDSANHTTSHSYPSVMILMELKPRAVPLSS